MTVNLPEIIKERQFRDLCAEELFAFYKGDNEELKTVIFPRQSWLTEDEYAILISFFAYVNLCKPSVNRIVSGVYGNPVKRSVENGSPYKDKVDGFLDESRGYSLKAREWFKSGVLYGPGIQVFYVGDDEEVHSWLPNPIRTEIVTNPHNVHDVVAIIEEVGPWNRAFVSGAESKIPIAKVNHKQIYRFVTKEAWGIADKDGNIIEFAEHGLGIVPAVICYGEDTRMYGEARGRSLVKSAPQFSKVVTKLLLNQVALIMNTVRPVAVVSGEVKNENPQEAFEPGGVMEMLEGGKFGFVKADTNFNDLTSTIDSYKANYCISEGIPMDALDPANMPENQSATSARLRNQPMSVTINRLVEEQKTNEIQALTIVGALYQMIDTESPVTFSKFAKRFKCSVHIEPSGAPESLSELAAAWAQLKALGAYTTEDIIRRAHGTAGETEIQRRVKEFEAAETRLLQQISQGDPAKNTETASDSPSDEDAA